MHCDAEPRFWTCPWYRSGTRPCLTRFRQGIFFDDFFRQPFFGKSWHATAGQGRKQKGCRAVSWVAGTGTRDTMRGKQFLCEIGFIKMSSLYMHTIPFLSPLEKSVVSRGDISSNPAIWMVMTDWQILVAYCRRDDHFFQTAMSWGTHGGRVQYHVLGYSWYSCHGVLFILYQAASCLSHAEMVLSMSRRHPAPCPPSSSWGLDLNS